MAPSTPLVRRLWWNLLPLVLVVGAVATTLMGDDGLMARHERIQRLHAAEARVDQALSDNERLRSEIRRMRQDPDVVRRAAAETLLLAEPGSTIYRFAPADQ